MSEQSNLVSRALCLFRTEDKGQRTLGRAPYSCDSFLFLSLSLLFLQQVVLTSVVWCAQQQKQTLWKAHFYDFWVLEKSCFVTAFSMNLSKLALFVKLCCKYWQSILGRDSEALTDLHLVSTCDKKVVTITGSRQFLAQQSSATESLFSLRFANVSQCFGSGELTVCVIALVQETWPCEGIRSNSVLVDSDELYYSEEIDKQWFIPSELLSFTRQIRGKNRMGSSKRRMFNLQLDAVKKEWEQSREGNGAFEVGWSRP